MFKKILKTSIELTRTGIETMTNVIASVTDPSPSEEAIEEEETPDSKKTSISGLKANLLRQANFKHEKIQLEKASKRTSVQKFRTPNLKFIAAGSNKLVELRKIHQTSVIFISHRENAKEAADLNWQLLQPHLLAKRIPFFTANIIILNEFPAFTHAMVKRELRKSYNDIVKDYIKDRNLAEKIVHLLPDWKGASLDGFHIAQRRPVLASVILNPFGNVQNVIYSANPLAAIRNELGL